MFSYILYLLLCLASKREVKSFWLVQFNSFMTEVRSYRKQSIDLQSKSMEWFLYDTDLRHERVKGRNNYYAHKQAWALK